MALPKYELTQYRHKLFGTDIEIRFRPFTVREQKILLNAKEEGDKVSKMDAIRQIINLCTMGDVDADKIPYFSAEDLFMRIRGKSVSDVATVVYKDKTVTDKVAKITVNINLDDVKVTVLPEHNLKIELTETMGLMMKYPTLTDLYEVDQKEDFEMLRVCIESVYDSEEVHLVKDQTDKDLDELLSSFDTKAMLKIKKFFDTMPRLRHEEIITLSDGTTETVKFEGLDSFFI